MTGHKSQGQTIDLFGLYVLLSRVRRPEDIEVLVRPDRVFDEVGYARNIVYVEEPQPPRYGINQLSSNWGEKTKNPVGTCPPIAKFGCPFIHGRTDRMGLTKDKIPHLEGVSNTSLIEFSPQPFPTL
ncbi:hypothetical protein J6590_099218 [Homalodisca vitripennis]|nr:hypothetical protein J6590_099218 [Homalodisca vitripennis]